MAQDLWKRSERAFVYLSERRARYASVTKNQAGRLLILFTHQTEDQEKAGVADLYCTRRTLDGDWWMYPIAVFKGDTCEPRAYGTMTTLGSGRIIAPFAELRQNETHSSVRMLVSADGGDTWSVAPPINFSAFSWAVPYGKPFELNEKLLMPVFGARTENELRETRLSSALLLSQDGGKSFCEYSLIAESTPELSYEFPAVCPLADGSLLAVITARSLKPRPYLPLDVKQTLVRSYSTDEGKTWSAPEQLGLGSWPTLIRIDEQTLACTYAEWTSWSHMYVVFSYDGFHTIRHRVPYISLNRIPIYGEDDIWVRPTDDHPRQPDTIPLPPVVPFLEGAWDCGHFGFSSGLALDRNRVLLVAGKMQRGSSYSDQPYEVKIPLEHERIEAVTVTRVPQKAGQPVIPSGVHGRARKQWRLAEQWSVEEWRKKVNPPPDDVNIELKSGRWVRINQEYIEPYQKGKDKRIIGRERGFWVSKEFDDHYYKTCLVASFSDDRGKSWQSAQIDEPVPLSAAVHPGQPAFEDTDGTLIVPVYGYLNHDDMAVSLYVSALCRSHDRGESWGDWSIIGYDRAARCVAYSETTVQPIPDGTWVAFLRSEHRSHVPVMIFYSRAVSTDRGYSWSEPEPCAVSGVAGTLMLPDGALAASGQQTYNWGLTISYDYGKTWNYALPASYSARGAVWDEKSFWLYDPTCQLAAVYRLS